jgi:phosphoribosyl-ATP pyrophosphohydrolase
LIFEFDTSGAKKYDQVWCVFDKDDFPKKNVEEAFELAHKEQIQVAYSNQSFELWYYLHFTYHDAALHRSDYIEKLKDKFGFQYRKNDPDVYFHLLDLQENAIKNAKKLSSSYGEAENVANCDPYTSVYLLVEELNRNLA